MINYRNLRQGQCRGMRHFTAKNTTDSKMFTIDLILQQGGDLNSNFNHSYRQVYVLGSPVNGRTKISEMTRMSYRAHRSKALYRGLPIPKEREILESSTNIACNTYIGECVNL